MSKYADKDRTRMSFLEGLVKHCPTATFLFNDDPDMTFPDGAPIPVGFTILVEDCCEPVRVTAPTFRKAIDTLQERMAKLESL